MIPALWPPGELLVRPGQAALPRLGELRSDKYGQVLCKRLAPAWISGYIGLS